MVAVLSGIASVGLFVSTRTDSGPGATVATIVAAIASQILDNIPSLHAIQPFLPTHGWLGSPTCSGSRSTGRGCAAGSW